MLLIDELIFIYGFVNVIGEFDETKPFIEIVIPSAIDKTKTRYAIPLVIKFPLVSLDVADNVTDTPTQFWLTLVKYSLGRYWLVQMSEY
ncbi:hypothetical protein KHA80_13360 [Anaerobacillus sp. HL2]|nr:hypothetical protein KHA80_13360 [Anaerobacillus sp. HL2]